MATNSCTQLIFDVKYNLHTEMYMSKNLWKQDTFDAPHELVEAAEAAFPLYLKHAHPRKGPVKKTTTEYNGCIQEIRFTWIDDEDDHFIRIYTLK